MQHFSYGTSALLAALAMTTACAATPVAISADVCVVGGGSAGIGAALAAARQGAQVVLIEREPALGGTSGRAYVCNWESGPACSIARAIYTRLVRIPDAVGILSDHNADRKKGPFGLWLITPGSTYEQTFRRVGLTRPHWRTVAFEPDALAAVARQLLEETGRCRILLRTPFVAAEPDGTSVKSILATATDGSSYRVQARVFIDCTGGAHLCRKLGCEVMLGPEPRSRFQESMAPDKPTLTLNAISLCYRVRKSTRPRRQEAPTPPVARWPHTAHVHSLPNGDLIVNPLPLLPGRTLVDVGYDRTMARAKPIVQAHWRWLQSFPTFATYEFDSVAPMLGIRESYRVVGEYVLRQQDLLAGIGKQKHTDIVALGDHTLDVHGSGGHRVRGKLKGAYGVPYRCLVPKGWTNLMVAGRCASFSHIAASSCRLSRTMMALGHAAGLGAAQAAATGVAVADVDVGKVQKALGLPPAVTDAPSR